jgi:hypothetical protein
MNNTKREPKTLNYTHDARYRNDDGMTFLKLELVIEIGLVKVVDTNKTILSSTGIPM